MNRSMMERIFPHTANSVLPQHEYVHMPSPSIPTSPPRITLRDSSSSSTSPPPTSSRKFLQGAALSTSIVHHANPFLQVDRAARSLQTTIQQYLDAQSDGLNASLGGAGADDLSSVGSPTPTPSIAAPSKISHSVKTIPIMQPVPKKVTLSGARRGLARSMENFAQLKREELRIIDTESRNRRDAVLRSQVFHEKKESIVHEIKSIQGEESNARAASLRAEANNVETEIRELENTLLEMKARHRQLIDQASQLESSIDSKISSYKSSLALIEKDVKQFLRRPPVSYSLSSSPSTGNTRDGMYSLNPERRTLEMAQEQWKAEQEMLLQRKENVQDEQHALQEGAKMWRNAITRIHDFEKKLRKALSRSPSATMSLTQTNGSAVITDQEDDPTPHLIAILSDLITSLEADLADAESANWNLLICCLGAELEALEQGRDLLQGEPSELLSVEQTTATNSKALDNEDSGPPEDLLRDGVDGHSSTNRSPSADSNRSLEDTLREFGNDPKRREVVQRTENEAVNNPEPLSHDFDFQPSKVKTIDSRYESEDDDPSPDFFLSHS